MSARIHADGPTSPPLVAATIILGVYPSLVTDLFSPTVEALLESALENRLISDAVIAESEKQARAFWRMRRTMWLMSLISASGRLNSTRPRDPRCPSSAHDPKYPS